MKILHTSDWHLGKKLESFSRISEQREVLEEIIQIADREQVNAIVICGDIFDSYNPSIEAEELYYKTIKKLSQNGKVPVIIIAGNHDSPERIDAPKPLAFENGIIVIGEPNQNISKFKLDTGLEVLNSDIGFLELKLPEINIPLRIITTPYVNEIRLKEYFGENDQQEKLREILKTHWQELSNKYCNEKGINILISHSLVAESFESIPDEPEGEKPIFKIGGESAIFTLDLPQNLHYVALGHLHKTQIISEKNYPVVYSGSPLAYSLSEAEQDKNVVIVQFDKSVKYKFVKLEKARKIKRKKFNSVDEALIWLKANQDFLVEVTIKTNEYLSSDDRKAIYDSHKGIISIIPEITIAEDEAQEIEEINVSENIETLFRNFFKREKGIEPNDEIIEIFREII